MKIPLKVGAVIEASRWLPLKVEVIEVDDKSIVLLCADELEVELSLTDVSDLAYVLATSTGEYVIQAGGVHEGSLVFRMSPVLGWKELSGSYDKPLVYSDRLALYLIKRAKGGTLFQFNDPFVDQDLNLIGIQDDERKHDEAHIFLNTALPYVIQGMGCESDEMIKVRISPLIFGPEDSTKSCGSCKKLVG